MSKATTLDKLIAEQERKLEEAIKKALDFSELHQSIERAEKQLEEAKKKIRKESK